MRKHGEMLFVTTVMIVISFAITTFISMRALNTVIDSNASNLSKIVSATIYDSLRTLLGKSSTTSLHLANCRFLAEHFQQDIPPDKLATDISLYLSTLQKGMDFDSASVVSLTTNTIYTPDGAEPYDATSERHGWVGRLLQSGKDSYVGLALRNTTSPVGMIFFNHVLKDLNGTPLGVCGVGMDLRRLQALIGSLEKEFSVKIQLTNKTGVPVFDAGGLVQGGTAIPGIDAAAAESDYVSSRSGNIYQVARAMEEINGCVVVRNETGGRRVYSELIRYNIIAIVLVLAILLLITGVVISREKKMLMHKAVTDPLTGISNRTGIEHETGRFMESGRGTGAMFIIDLDNFKTVNDTLGHPTGDQVLKDMAKYLCSVFRGRDMVARLGGDEFMVFTPGLGQPNVISRKAEELVASAARVLEQDGNKVPVSISVGVAVYPHHGRDYKTLYQHADLALYQSKEHGRNTWCLYGKSVADRTAAK